MEELRLAACQRAKASCIEIDDLLVKAEMLFRQL